jgi:hypothetical protein
MISLNDNLNTSHTHCILSFDVRGTKIDGSIKWLKAARPTYRCKRFFLRAFFVATAAVEACGSSLPFRGSRWMRVVTREENVSESGDFPLMLENAINSDGCDSRLLGRGVLVHQ